MRRWRRWIQPGPLCDLAAIAAVIWVTVWALHPSLLFNPSTLVTGGDTGAHLALPYFVKSIGEPFNLTPWYPGWFAGLPLYSYYFVLPDILVTWASYLIPFTLAMKLGTILGSVLMPVCAYVMGRCFKAPRPIPAALAMSTLPFLFDASYTIVGGNLFSTLAGEYAYSLSLALALLAIGLFARGVRTGKGYWMSAIALSLSLAAHSVPWVYALVAIAVVLVFEQAARLWASRKVNGVRQGGDRARPTRFAVVGVGLSLCLSAWWLLPLYATRQDAYPGIFSQTPVATLTDLLTNLGWTNATGGAAGDRWVIILAGVGVLVALFTRERLGLVLSVLCALSVVAFRFDNLEAVWNARLLPWWFISVHLLAGWVVGYLLWRWASASRARWIRRHLADEEVAGLAELADTIEERESAGARSRGVTGTIAVIFLGLASVVPGQITSVATDLHLATGGNQISVWAETNYSGYQAQVGWPEYQNVIHTMERVARRYGCGRAMWEYNDDEGRFGTTEALMLLPYWTNNCVDSMEGLLFQSSATTPYHFLTQTELSASPNRPIYGLDYGNLDVPEGIEHLQLYGVKYFFAFSPVVVLAAEKDPNLQLVATSKKWPAPGATWYFFRVKDSPTVAPLTKVPNVVANVGTTDSWLAAAQDWWLNHYRSGVYMAASGPSSWPRASSVDDMTSVALPSNTVTDIRTTTQTISFHVSRVGVPVVVRTSYYPSWHVDGGTGPYRASPNLMIVVPTSHHVRLVYANTPAQSIGYDITGAAILVGVLGALGWLLRRRRRRTVGSFGARRTPL